MALNIKNENVERLATEVARIAGETKTEAIRRALEEETIQFPPVSSSSIRSTRVPARESVPERTSMVPGFWTTV